MSEGYQLPKGWALRVPKRTTRYTVAQKTYLKEKFDVGIDSNKKYNPVDIAKQMRKQPQFAERDWLTWQQIASYWSRLSKEREQTVRAGIPEQEDDDDVKSITDNVYVNAIDEHMEEVINNVISTIFE
jgi:hypothetical protein